MRIVDRILAAASATGTRNRPSGKRGHVTEILPVLPYPMVDRNDVSASDAHLGQRLRSVFEVAGGRNAQRERQSVGCVPPDASNRSSIKRIGQGPIQIVGLLNAGQPNRPAFRWIGVIRVTGFR